jgi:hypothetical protein
MKLDELIDVRLLAPMATGIGIVVSTILWTKNQRTKQLSYIILWQDALTHVRSNVRDRLDIRFDGEPVHEARLVLVQIINSGHLPIAVNDYQSKLSISCSPGAKVLYAEVIATTPGDLDDRCRSEQGSRKDLIEHIDKNEVTIAPILLNDGDSMTVQMLVENLRGSVKVGGHINGIRRITVWRPSTLVSTVLTNIGALVMAAAMLLCEPHEIFRYDLPILAAVLFFLLGYTLLSAGLYAKQKNMITHVEPVV